jgi:hypothetical protein
LEAPYEIAANEDLDERIPANQVDAVLVGADDEEELDTVGFGDEVELET